MKPVLPLWLLIVAMLISYADVCLAEAAGDRAGEQLQKEPLPSKEKADPRDDPAFQREMAKAMFLIAIFVVAGFFLFVLIITIVRVTRHYRNRMKIGQKGDKTEYIDAWSQYKLKEEDEN